MTIKKLERYQRSRDAAEGKSEVGGCHGTVIFVCVHLSVAIFLCLAAYCGLPISVCCLIKQLIYLFLNLKYNICIVSDIFCIQNMLLVLLSYDLMCKFFVTLTNVPPY